MKVITRGELHDKIRNDGYAVTDLMNYIEIGVSTCPEATVSIDLIDSEKVMLLWSATPCTMMTMCRHSFLGCTSSSRHRRCTVAE